MASSPDPNFNPDPIFNDARLAALYDTFDGNRDDLDAYEAIIDELGARSVLDVGCGTGTLPLRLVAKGIDVVALDPAGASLDQARRKPGADRVRWVHGVAAALPAIAVDLAVMTGNVAQVFLTDDVWSEALQAISRSLTPRGHLVFETRIPERRAWEEWTPEASFQRGLDAEGKTVERWNEVTNVDLPFVTFDGTFRFADGTSMSSTSTLRFRNKEEIERSLGEAGFAVVEVREAPDRPGKEMVFIAVRSRSHGESPRDSLGSATAPD